VGCYLSLNGDQVEEDTDNNNYHFSGDIDEFPVVTILFESFVDE